MIVVVVCAVVAAVALAGIVAFVVVHRSRTASAATSNYSEMKQ